MYAPLHAYHAAHPNKVQDEYRLPDGMKRVGYDADTQVYTYQDDEGGVWEGAPGNRYGELHKGIRHSALPRPRLTSTVGQVHRSPAAAGDDRDHLLADADRLDCGELGGYRAPPRDDSWRYLAPFLLLICLFLLGVYAMLGGGAFLLPFFGGGSSPSHSPSSSAAKGPCVAGQDVHVVVAGDTCWAVARGRDMSLQQLESMNGELDCDALRPGRRLCVARHRVRTLHLG
jgi:hypothetical protein